MVWVFWFTSIIIIGLGESMRGRGHMILSVNKSVVVLKGKRYNLGIAKIEVIGENEMTSNYEKMKR